MAAVTRFGIEGYMSRPAGSFAGKAPAVGFSPGAASPTEIGRRLADRPGLWFLPFLLLLAL